VLVERRQRGAMPRWGCLAVASPGHAAAAPLSWVDLGPLESAVPVECMVSAVYVPQAAVRGTGGEGLLAADGPVPG